MNHKKHQPPPPPPASVFSQMTQSVVGEIVGTAVSIGAVYLAEYACPAKTQAVANMLAHRISRVRGTAIETEVALAKRITDFTIMNIGGLANVGVLLGMRHQTQKKGEAPVHVPYETARVIGGRIAGTVAALGSYAAMEMHCPAAMRNGGAAIGKLLGNGSKAHRFGDLLMSDAVQSAGALAGSIPAQLLFDRLVGSPKQHG